MSGTADGKQKYSLIRELLTTPQRYEYDMAVRLLRSFFGSSVRISTRPELTLGFNANDISRVEILDLTQEAAGLDRRTRNFRTIEPEELMDRYADMAEPPVAFVFYVNFLGLYGSSSPIPIYYTEALMQDDGDDNPSTADLVSFINEPVYHLYERGKSKYRLFNLITEKQSPEVMERILMFAGLSVSRIRNEVDNVYELLPYLGLFSMFPRSTEALRVIFSSELPECDIEIREFSESLNPIPAEQLMELGVRNSTLGIDAYAGIMVRSADSDLKIGIGCRDKEIFDSLMPGGEIHGRLSRILDVYMVDRIRIELRVTMENRGSGDMAVGSPVHELGLNSFLGGGFRRQIEFTVPLEY